MSLPRRFNWMYLVYFAGAVAIVSAAKMMGAGE
jgi:hypothetical protein